MSEIKIKLFDSHKIRWVGITDFSGMYKSMKQWLEDNGYLKNQQTLETKYIQRTKPDGKRQLEVSWVTTKSVSDFFEYHIDTTLLALATSDTDIQQEDGSKRKMQKGDFEIRVTSYLKSTSTWDELKGLKKFYQEMFIRKRMNLYLEELYKKTASYQSYIKGLIGLRD
tara:strand:+ start:123 stop:626 length:504 start_codon:yes stop_codon:yes gene_type:complete